MISGVVFTLIAGLQATRAAMGWEVQVNGSAVPIWASVVVALITGLLAIFSFRTACCVKCCCGKGKDEACCKKDGKCCCGKADCPECAPKKAE